MLDPAGVALPRSCALASQLANEHPIGWAIAARRLVLVEVPLPWPTAIEQAAGLPPGLAEVVAALESRAADDAPRLEGIAPEPAYSLPGRVRVVLLERSAGGRPGYARAERVVPPGEVAGLVEAWSAGTVAPDPPSEMRDIVVCTHGSHDTCCGRFGAPIQRALVALATGLPGLRVWRGSHTGGHRFSPTLVDLPDGRSWGRLRPADLGAILARTGDAAALRDRYRGLGTLPTFYERLVEAELLFRHGWTWLDRHVEGEVIEGHRFSYPEEPDELDEAASVRITSTAPDGSRAAWEAQVVRAGETVTRGECGDEPWVAPSYRVASLVPLQPTARPRVA